MFSTGTLFLLFSNSLPLARSSKEAIVVVVVVMSRVLVFEFLVLDWFLEKTRHQKDLEGGGFYAQLQCDSLRGKSQWQCVD